MSLHVEELQLVGPNPVSRGALSTLEELEAGVERQGGTLFLPFVVGLIVKEFELGWFCERQGAGLHYVESFGGQRATRDVKKVRFGARRGRQGADVGLHLCMPVEDQVSDYCSPEVGETQ